MRWLARSHPRFPRGLPDSTRRRRAADGDALRSTTRPHPRAKCSWSPSTAPAARPATGRTRRTNVHTAPAQPTASSGAASYRSQPTRCTSAKGLADGLRILRYADEPALVAVCAGTGYGRIQPGHFETITLWPDADEAGARSAQATQRWADLGYKVSIKRLPAGHDPASAPLQVKVS